MDPLQIHEPAPSESTSAERLEAEAFAALRTIYVPVRQARPAQSPVPLTRLIATHNGAVLGTLLYHIDDDRLHIRSLAVAPDARRRGVARALIDHCAALARQQHLGDLSTYTILETGNLPIFQRLGFTLIRHHPADFATTPTGGPVTEAFLECSLV
jgi:ribosomal protein S18 acetylase RimI-like enzyme